MEVIVHSVGPAGAVVSMVILSFCKTVFALDNVRSGTLPIESIILVPLLNGESVAIFNGALFSPAPTV